MAGNQIFRHLCCCVWHQIVGLPVVYHSAYRKFTETKPIAVYCYRSPADFGARKFVPSPLKNAHIQYGGQRRSIVPILGSRAPAVIIQSCVVSIVVSMNTIANSTCSPLTKSKNSYRSHYHRVAMQISKYISVCTGISFQNHQQIK